MTSPTKRVSRAQTEQLLAWMKQHQPRVYAGLVRRFTPASQVAGITDIISSIGAGAGKVVDGITNFFNSQGGQSLLTAAQPFLQTSLEKKQLQLNLQRMQNGLPIQQYPVAGQPGYDPYGNNDAFLPTSSGTGVSIPWLWLGLGGLGLGLLLSMRRR